MASSSRTDRQLMRQRGAGLRNVDTIDFAFKLGTQNSRDDRQLMRQRGAGRKVDNIDFGFSFPTPSQSRRSSRTPQTAKRDARRSSKTPASTGRKQASMPQTAQADAVESQNALTSQRRLSTTPPRNAEPQKPNSGKRRRTSKNIEGLYPEKILVNIPRLAQPLLEVSNIGESRQNESVMHDEDAEVTRIKDFGISRQIQTLKDASLPAHPDGDKENAPSVDGDLGLTEDREVFGSLLDQPTIDGNHLSISLARGSIAQSIEEPDTAEFLNDNHGDDAAKLVDHSPNLNQSNQIQQLPLIHTAEAVDHVAGSETTARKRKKRKSVVLGPRKKRRSSEVTRQSLSLVDVETSPERYTQPSDSKSDERSEEQQDITRVETTPAASREKPLPLWKKLAARRMQGRRNRLSVSASPTPREDEDEEADETYVEEDDSPEPITPAAKRKKKDHKKSGQGRAHGRTDVKQRVESSRTSFPIVTYRTANIEALPTILEENERGEDSETDEVRLPDAFSNRSQPNAVDILAQICRETIQNALEKLGTASASTSRAEIKHKRTALEAFGERVDQRLFDMSQAVEQRMTSEARLRKSKREKAGLQARWIEIRRQRDELALKSDHIRRQNWENEEEGKRQFEVSELAHRTELELERGEFDDNNVEFMLRHVGGNISAAAGQGGILSRIKSFNGQLERLAVALEGR